MTSLLVQLAWLLIASIPICLVVSAAFEVCCWLFRRLSPSSMYRLGCIAVFICVLSPGVVLWWQLQDQAPLQRVGADDDELPIHVRDTVDDVVMTGENVARPTADQAQVPSFAREYLVAVALVSIGALWSLVTPVLLFKQLASLPYVWKWLLRNAQRMSPDKTARLDALAKKIGIKESIIWLETPHGNSPILAGWKYPVIVIPEEVSRSLSQSELECLIAHELAHLRFGDAFWNVLLNFVAVPFFYQPWMKGLIRRTMLFREFRSDDFAVRHVGDSVAYARALRKLANEGAGRLAFELSAGSELVSRLERLLRGRVRPRPAWVGLINVAVMCSGLVLLPYVASATRSMPRYSRQVLYTSPLRPSIVVDRAAMPLADVENDGRIVLPNSGRLTIIAELPHGEGRDWTIDGVGGRTTVVQVRSVSSARPFIRASWPDSEQSTTSDTDAGSGRGDDALLVIPGNPHLHEIELGIIGAAQTGGRILVMLWQPQVAEDIDADYLGFPASLLKLDNHLRAQVPAGHNTQPPAINYEGDIDTFQVWLRQSGQLVITANGFRGKIHPFVRVHDDKGHALHAGAYNPSECMCRVVIDKPFIGETGYFIAVSGSNGEMGEYSLQVHLD